MPNGPERAEFWRSFIFNHCGYPAPERLRAQLAVAELHSFCACGCNSFDVRISPDSNVLPLATPGSTGGMFFDVDFALATGDHVQLLLFVDASGNLSFVEIDLNANSAPVPDVVEIAGPIQQGYVSASLFLD